MRPLHMILATAASVTLIAMNQAAHAQRNDIEEIEIEGRELFEQHRTSQQRIIDFVKQIEQLRHKAIALEEKGQEEAAQKVALEIRELEEEFNRAAQRSQMEQARLRRQMAERGPRKLVEQQHRHPHEEARRRTLHHDKEAQEAEHRIEHMQAAVKHLREAGLSDLARATQQRLEQYQRELHARRAHRHHPELEREVRALRQQVERLQNALRKQQHGHGHDHEEHEHEDHDHEHEHEDREYDRVLKPRLW